MTADFAKGSGLNRRVTRGAVWMIALRLTDRVIGFLSTIVLARLLIPADFGLIALATTMMAAIGVLAEFGFETALIQRQDATRSHYDTAWTLGLLRGLFATVIIALASEPIARFFDDPRLRDVVLVLALTPLLQGFYNIGTVDFRKDLALHKEFVFRIVPRIAGVVVTIVFAFAWRNYWALVYGTLAGAGLRLVLGYVMHRYRPRITVSAWRDIMGFSKWMLATGIASFANEKLSTLIIAKFLDTTSVGIFSLAVQISDLASAELIAPIKQALFPAYATIAHDIVLLRKAFLDAYGLLVLVALPIAIGIGLTADLFVPILLGPKWIDAVPLIQILAVSGGLRSLITHVRPLYLAMGQPQLGAYAAIGRALVLLPALYLGVVWHGVLGIAIVHAAGFFIVVVGSFYRIRKLIGLWPHQFLGFSWRAMVGCGSMIVAVEAIKWSIQETEAGLAGQLSVLAVSVVAGAFTYIATVLLSWLLCNRPSNSAESYVLAEIARSIGKRAR